MTHGAVIAREYGLPAVVGVAQATRLIRAADPRTRNRRVRRDPAVTDHTEKAIRSFRPDIRVESSEAWPSSSATVTMSVPVCGVAGLGWVPSADVVGQRISPDTAVRTSPQVCSGVLPRVYTVSVARS
jgi:hypothetical protein